MNRNITVLRQEELLTRDYLFALVESVRRVGVGRRRFLEWGTQMLYDWVAFGGIIFTGEGEQIAVYPGVFDDEHSENSEGEWVSDQRGRDYPRRRPAQRLIGRLRLYDAIFRIAGRPVEMDVRRQEVEETRRVLRSFTPVLRVRYLHDVRRLRREHVGAKAAHYSAAVRRLRIRLAEELAEGSTQS